MSTQINQAVLAIRVDDVTNLAEKFGFDLAEAKKFLKLDEEKRGESPKKKEKKEKKGKEEKPKRAHTKTGYQIFSDSIRAEVTAELRQDLGEGEKMERGATQKKCGELWKALEQSERDVWNTKAKTPEASDDECELEDN